MGFVNCKNAAQLLFMLSFHNKTPLIDFGLNLLATGHAEQTIRISVVMSPVNFCFLTGWKGALKTAEVKSTYFLLCESSPGHPSSIYAWVNLERSVEKTRMYQCADLPEMVSCWGSGGSIQQPEGTLCLGSPYSSFNFTFFLAERILLTL